MAEREMLDWQHKWLLAELALLQDHAADSTCPCRLKDMGEWCIPKHALKIMAYASETASMDPDNAELLFELQDDANRIHELTRKHVCSQGDEEDIVSWARNWRKRIEPIYYSCKSMALVEDPAARGVIRVHRKADLSDACEIPSERYRYLTAFFGQDFVALSDVLLSDEETVRRIDIALAKLEDGVKSVQDSDNFRRYLDTMARFHRYSLGNVMLIGLQFPSATLVAGYQKWKELSRFVKKGSSGIMILAPCFASKIKVASKPVEGEEEEIQEIDPTPVYFRVVHVFDVSQTDGESIPRVEVPVLQGDATAPLYQTGLSLAAQYGLIVRSNSDDPMYSRSSSLMGYFRPANKEIWIRPDAPQEQKTKTLFHELAHALSVGKYGPPGEVLAESVAYTVCHHAGFDTGARSFPYVAVWGQDIKLLKQNMDHIREISRKMIDDMESLASLSDVKVKISGSCTKSDCRIKVKGSDSIEASTSAIGELPEIIDEVTRTLDAKTAASDRTFAIGSNSQERYEFRYKVIEARDLIVSHNPFSFVANPEYPQELQPRLRDRAATILQVKTIAQNLDPDSLLNDFQSLDRGAPIVGPDNIVESGNGRVMALLVAGSQENPSYSRYVDALKIIAPRYKINPKSVNKFTMPVLVRERISKVKRKQFVEEANAATTIESSAIEKARTDADKISFPMIQSALFDSARIIRISSVPPKVVAALASARAAG